MVRESWLEEVNSKLKFEWELGVGGWLSLKYVSDRRDCVN